MIYYMKKIVFVSLIAFVVLSAFLSCTNELQKKNFTDELQFLNEEICTQIDYENQKGKSKFWGKVGRVCAIVGADIIGAYEGGKIGATVGAAVGTIVGPAGTTAGTAVGATVGAAVCGGGASYAASQGCKNFTDPYPMGYTYTLSSSYANIDSAGFFHNEYLDLLFKNDTISSLKIYDELFSNSYDSVLFFTIYEHVGNESSKFAQVSMVIDNFVSSDYDVDALISDCSSVLCMSETAFEFWKYFFDMLSVAQNVEDAQFIIENYIKFILENEDIFDETEIRSLKNALIIGLCSLNYWSITL